MAEKKGKKMARFERKNPNSPNFGLGSRDMSRAGLHALREGMQSFSSISTIHDRWRVFADFAKSELRLHRLQQIEKSHLQIYGANLRERFERGELSAATAQNYLSAVNRVLEIARGDRAVRLDPVRGAGLPQRTGICTQSKAVDAAAHQRAVASVGDRVRALIGLQREMGLRFAESAKINANKALAQAVKTGAVTVRDGTKGGRPRTVPISRPEQLAALRSAAEIQGRDRSMIPASQTYVQFRNEMYAQIVNTETTYHGNRHHYAQQRYLSLVGVPCPVAAGIPHREHHQHLSSKLGISRGAARELDRAARMQVSQELGHGIIDVTNSYLG